MVLMDWGVAAFYSGSPPTAHAPVGFRSPPGGWTVAEPSELATDLSPSLQIRWYRTWCRSTLLDSVIRGILPHGASWLDCAGWLTLAQRPAHQLPLKARVTR